MQHLLTKTTLSEFRATWRPSTHFSWAVSLENPEQEIGKLAVTLPVCCAIELLAQYNTGADELRVPNLIPDISTRVAFNPTESFHVDVGGVFRRFRHAVRPSFESFKKVGAGGTVNVRVKLSGSSGAFVQGSFGSGIGRYVGGLVPDVALGVLAPEGALVAKRKTEERQGRSGLRANSLQPAVSRYEFIRDAKSPLDSTK